MAKQQFAVRQSCVRPNWKMRSHAWLDTTTLTPKYSVQARDPDAKGWAHVYNGDTREMIFFATEEEAHGFIQTLRQASVECKEERDA